METKGGLRIPEIIHIRRIEQIYVVFAIHRYTVHSGNMCTVHIRMCRIIEDTYK